MDLMRDGKDSVTRWDFYQNMQGGPYKQKIEDMLEWYERIDSNDDQNITQSEVAGAMFLNYDKIDQLMQADVDGNGNITREEFCVLEFGEATIFCGHQPDIMIEEGEIAPSDFIDVWYRYIDKNADEVINFE